MLAALLNPWAIAIGGAAVALPVVIHLLARPRPRRMPLPTIRFLRHAIDERRSRSHLRDRLLLALRVLAVGLLGLAFARPLWGTRSLLPQGPDAQVTRIILLDVSQSMSATDAAGVSTMARSRALAADALRGSGSLQADVILAGATPQVTFASPSSNLTALRETIAQANAHTEGLDAAAAIDAAGRLLANTPAERRRELIVVSDFQRTNWSAAAFAALPVDTDIRFVAARPASPIANVAITRVTAHGRAESGQPLHIDVDLLNDSEQPQHATVQLTLADRSTRAEVDLPPQGRQTFMMEVDPPAAGWAVGEARLINNRDAIAADDLRPIALQVQSAPTTLLLTRESATPAPVSSHFVERALMPRGERVQRITRATADHVDATTLSQTSLLVIDHPGNIDAATADQIAQWVRRGHGLLYIAAEPVDADNLGELGRAAGTDWNLPVMFQAPAEGRDRTGRFFAEWRRDAPGIDLLGESAGAAVGPLRFAGGLDTTGREGGLADDVLITYGDRSAALTLSACGAGRVAVLNADLSRANLVASPLFVPLLGELCDRLLTSSLRDDDARPCGLPIAVELPAGSQPDVLRMVGPGDDVDAGELRDEGGRTLWRWLHAGSTGVYRVTDGEKIVHAIATAAPASESELASIDPNVLTTRLAAGRSTQYVAADAAGDQHRDTGWAWLLLGVTGCLVLEFGVGRWLGR